MGVIAIDDKLQQSDGLAKFILFLFEHDKVKVPKLGLFEILLTKFRSGLDSEAMSSDIISKFEKIGIPSGSLEGGQPNVMEEYTKLLMETVVDAIQNDMRIDVAVDSGMIVTSTGGNAGGPVASTGSNVEPHTGSALAS